MSKPSRTETLVVPMQTVRFHKVNQSDGVFPNYPSALMVQVGKRLRKHEVERLAQLVGYAWRQHVRGESLTEVNRQGHDKVVFWCADSTKSVRDDLGHAWDDFLDALPAMIREGSPVRTTNRAGAGTRGTRLVEGLGDVGGVSVWVDDVFVDEQVAKENREAVAEAEAVSLAATKMQRRVGPFNGTLIY